MEDYDNDELGVGNSQHPANQPEELSNSELGFSLLTLQECLDYYKETKDIEPLENKIKEVSEGNKESKEIIIQTIKALRRSGFDATANLLCKVRDLIAE
jgi:hypothetical protein